MWLLKNVIFFVTVYFSCTTYANVILVKRNYVQDLR